MDDDIPETLRLTGEVRALYVALLAAIECHPQRASAAAAARAAVEREIVEAMNTPGTPEAWLRGMHDLQARLVDDLNARYPAPR